MKEIKLVIKGNQENQAGNPIPYLRTTQGSQWTDKAKRYQDWKGHVVATFIDMIQAMPKEERSEYSHIIDLGASKPIKSRFDKIKMSLAITFKDKTHADSDNIFKGIADALFANDKHVVGEFDYEYGESGKVEVTIQFL